MTRLVDINRVEGANRVERFEAAAREYVVNPWGEDVTGELPLSLSRYLLVERNVGSAAVHQPAYFTTHDTAADAATYYVSQEYREDWDPEGLVDLDTGDIHLAVLSMNFEPPVPPVVTTVSYPERAEDRPCATCKEPIQPGQLYITTAPFHIGCAPKED